MLSIKRSSHLPTCGFVFEERPSPQHTGNRQIRWEVWAARKFGMDFATVAEMPTSPMVVQDTPCFLLLSGFWGALQLSPTLEAALCAHVAAQPELAYCFLWRWNWYSCLNRLLKKNTIKWFPIHALFLSKTKKMACYYCETTTNIYCKKIKSGLLQLFFSALLLL